MSPKVSEEPAARVYKKSEDSNNIFPRNFGRSLPKFRRKAQDDFNLQVYDFYETWGFHKES